MGIFGNLFDLNGDGKMDTLEQAADFAHFMTLLESEEDEESDEDDTG